MPRALLRARILLFATALCCAVFSVFPGQETTAAVGIARQINYQAKLLTSGGVPVADGTYSVKFSIYDSSSGGTRLWTAAGTTVTPSAVNVAVESGLFTVQLGDTAAGQNALDFDFNQDTLYLGVTISADSEMAPRKRLTAVPYAFEAEALQGQYASSSVLSAGGTLFKLSQQSKDAAVADRAALGVYTSGTSDAFDYLIKANSGSDVFTVSRQGHTTTTGNLAVNGNTILGDASTDTVTFNGQINSSLIPSTNNGFDLGSASNSWANIYASGTASIKGNITSLASIQGVTLVGTTQVITNQLLRGGSSAGFVFTQQTFGSDTTDIQIKTSSPSALTRWAFLTTGHFLPLQNNLYDFGSAASSVRSIYASGTAYIGTDVVVGGSSVCLKSGVNCPAGGTTDLNWTYNLGLDLMSEATATTDIVIGGSATTSAPVFFSLLGETVSSSRLILGQNQNMDVVIGGTTSTATNTLFQFSGNDLFTQGDIGSAGSMYVNGSMFAQTSVSSSLLIANLGTVGAPSFTFSGDSDTGLYSPTANVLAVTTSGTERMRVDAAGNVGIGTSAPLHNLSVKGQLLIGTTGGEADVTGFNPSFTIIANGPVIDFTNTSAAANNKIWTIGELSGSQLIGRVLSDDVGSAQQWIAVTRSNATVSSVVFPNGRVGIGTTNPSSTLDVNGQVSSTAVLTGAIRATLNDIWDIGSTTSSFANIYASGTLFIGGVTSSGPISPFANNSYDIGTSLTSWRNIYASGTLFVGGVTSTGSITAFTNNTYDLGTSVTAWRNIYASGTLFVGGVTSSGPISPFTNNAYDIGTAVNSWKDVYASGTIYAVSQTLTGTSTAGPFSFAADSGAVTGMDYPCTISSPSEQPCSYDFDVNSIPFFTVYSRADGAGGLQTTSTAIRFYQPLLPSPNNSIDIGAMGTNAVRSIYTSSTIFAGGVSSTGNINPTTNNSYDLGGADVSWRNIYASGTLFVAGVTSTGPISPFANNTYDFGTASTAWRNIYASGTLFTGGVTSTGPMSPFTNNAYDIGTSAKSWRNIYASGTLFVAGVTSTGPISPFINNTYDLGTAVNSWHNIYASGTLFVAGVTSSGPISPFATNSYDLGSPAKSWANIYASGTLFVATDVKVNGTSVCLSTGSNCPAGSSVTNFFTDSGTLIELVTSTRQLALYSAFTAPSVFATSTADDALRTLGGLSASGTITAAGRANLPYLDRWFTSPLLTQTVYKGGNATTTMSTTVLAAAFDGSHIWVANNGSNTVSKIDPLTNATVATTTVGTNPTSITFDGNYIWVTNNNTAAVNKIDIKTNTSIALVTTGANTGGSAFDGTYLWVTNSGDGTVNKIDASIMSGVGTPIATVPVGSSPIGIAFDGRYMWVSNNGSNSVTKIDVSTNAVVATTTVGAGPIGIAFDGSYMWVANNTANNVSKIDITTNTVVATTSVGVAPRGVAFDGQYIWVTNGTSNNVSVIDPITNAVVATKATGAGPYGIAFDGSHMWIPNFGSTTVSKIPIGVGNGTTENFNVNLGLALNNTFDIGSASNSLRNIYASGTLFVRGVTSTGPVSAYTNNTYDLGTSLKSWRNIYASGTAFVGGVTSTGPMSPFTTNLYDIGTSLTSWRNIYASGTLFVGGVTSTGPMSPFTNNLYDIGTSVTSWKNIYASGTLFVHGVTSTGPMSPFTNNASDLGSAATAWGNIYASGSASLGGLTVSSTSNILLRPNDYVGIGTSTPSEKLSVTGNIRNLLSTGENFTTLNLSVTLTSITSAQGFAVSGRYGYIGDAVNGWINVIDLSVPATPVVVGTLNIGPGSGIHGMAVAGSYAYVNYDSAGTMDLAVIDVSNPTSPIMVANVSSTADGSGNYGTVKISGNKLYTNGDASLHIYDISNPVSPVEISFFGPGTSAITSFAVSGKYAYVSTGATSTNFMVVDVTTSTSPTLVGQLGWGSRNVSREVSIQGRYAYLAGFVTTSSLAIIDISNPTAPSLKSEFVTDNGGGFTNYGVKVQGRYAYLGNGGSSTVDVYDVSDATNPVRLFGKTAIAGDYLEPQGGYLYAVGSNNFSSYKIPGVMTASLDADSAEVGSMSVRGSATVNDQLNVNSGLYVGSAGIHSDGAISSAGPNTSTFKGDVIANNFDVGGTIYGATTMIMPSAMIMNAPSGFFITTAAGTVFSINPAAFSMSLDPAGPGVAGDLYLANDATDNLHLRGKVDFALSAGVVSDILPDNDNTRVLGSASARWRARFAGVTSTSMEPETDNLNQLGNAANRWIGHFSTLDATQTSSTFVTTTRMTAITSITASTTINDAAGIFIKQASSTSLATRNMAGIIAYVASSTTQLDFGDRPALDFLDPTPNGDQITAAGFFVNNFSDTTAGKGGQYGVLAVDNTSSTVGGAIVGIRRCGGANGDVMFLATSTGAVTRRVFSVRCDGTVHNPAGAMSATADYAEYFPTLDSTLTSGEVVTLNVDTASSVKRAMSNDRAYAIGVISTHPSLLANSGVDDSHADNPYYKAVGLLGQIPTNVSTAKGVIRAGDNLMAGDDGYAVKASGVGLVIGQSLEDLATATGSIMVYVNPGWSANGVLEAMGSSTAVLSQGIADATTTAYDSFGLSFTGSFWDATTSAAMTSSFTLQNDVISAASSLFTIRNTSNTAILTISDVGDLSVTGDLTVGRRLFLGSKTTGVGSTSTYLFVDDTQAPTSTYIATNADGWSTLTTYDYAERFHSDDALVPGDLVAADAHGTDRVRRTASKSDVILGIVSTKPGFITGGYATGTYPIALAGRVPTRVSTANGAIVPGDLLAPSDVPGVAVKAIATGPTFGIALEAYDAPAEGKISVFVQPGWKGGEIVSSGGTPAAVTYVTQQPSATSERSGLAKIFAGSNEVNVTFPSIGAYPLVTVSPYGQTAKGWWLTNVTDHGFTIIVGEAPMFDLVLSWKAEPSQAGSVMSFSDGTSAPYDPTSGLISSQPQATSTNPIVPTSTPPVTDLTLPDAVSSTLPSIDTTSSSISTTTTP